MFSGSNSRRGRASLALTGVLSLIVVSAHQAAPAPDETIVAPITVRASNSAQEMAAAEFLTAFISPAVRFEGSQFIAWLATAVKLRTDLAGRIVVCSLDIARLNTRLNQGRLSFATIGQIIKGAVGAAPKTAPDIVKAAIKSEPYARGFIIASAIAAAPDEQPWILAAVGETMPMSILPTAGRFNPADNAPFDNVNSPEQPPIGP
jgi:hypothetical protein